MDSTLRLLTGAAMSLPGPPQTLRFVDYAAHARNVLDMEPREGGLGEGELKTLHEMAIMIARRLEADMAAAARASAKDELLRSLDFVRAPFALCTLALDGRVKVRYANSGWAWETGACDQGICRFTMPAPAEHRACKLAHMRCARSRPTAACRCAVPTAPEGVGVDAHISSGCSGQGANISRLRSTSVPACVFMQLDRS